MQYCCPEPSYRLLRQHTYRHSVILNGSLLRRAREEPGTLSLPDFPLSLPSIPQHSPLSLPSFSRDSPLCLYRRLHHSPLTLASFPSHSALALTFFLHFSPPVFLPYLSSQASRLRYSPAISIILIQSLWLNTQEEAVNVRLSVSHRAFMPFTLLRLG